MAGDRGAKLADARAADAGALIDHDHLDSLSRHIGRAATCELLACGRAELVDRLARLARHAGAGPGGTVDADVGSLVHQVAGLAGNLGLRLVARHATRAATAVRAGHDACGALAALRETGDPSLAALDDWCAAAPDDAA